MKKPKSRKWIRRTIWITDSLWTAIRDAARTDERTASYWLRKVVEEKLKSL